MYNYTRFHKCLWRLICGSQLEGYGSGEGLEDKSIPDKRATHCKPHEEGTLQSKLAGSEFKLIWGKIATLWIQISLKHRLWCFEAPLRLA